MSNSKRFFVWKKSVTSIWRSGHGYASSVPMRLLKTVGIYRDVEQYELEWFCFVDSKVHDGVAYFKVRVRPRKGYTPIPASPPPPNTYPIQQTD
jgi:hypothetical protein